MMGAYFLAWLALETPRHCLLVLGSQRRTRWLIFGFLCACIFTSAKGNRRSRLANRELYCFSRPHSISEWAGKTRGWLIFRVETWSLGELYGKSWKEQDGFLAPEKYSSHAQNLGGYPVKTSVFTPPAYVYFFTPAKVGSGDAE